MSKPSGTIIVSGVVDGKPGDPGAPGAPGESPWIADLDNEMDSVSCDQKGYTVSQQTVSTVLSLYHGATAETFTLSQVLRNGAAIPVDKDKDGVTVTFSNQTLSVTYAADTLISDKDIFRLTLVNGTVSRNLEFVVRGVQGEIYNVLPSVRQIVCSVDEQGNYLVNGSSAFPLSCGYTKKDIYGAIAEQQATAIYGGTEGQINEQYAIFYSLRSRATGKWWMYDEARGIVTDGNYNQCWSRLRSGSVIDVNIYDAVQYVIIKYPANGSGYAFDPPEAIFDREDVYVVSNGQKGDSGTSPVVIDLDNQSDSLPCDSAGYVTETTVITTRAYISRGARRQTNVTAEDASLLGVTATPSVSDGFATYNWTFSKGTHIEAEKDVTDIYVTFEGVRHHAQFSLGVVKSGKPGESPVIWQLAPTVLDFAFARDASNNLTPSQILCNLNVVKRVGNKITEYTSHVQGLYILWGFDDGGQEGTKYVGGVFAALPSEAMLHSSVWFSLRDSDGRELDRESIPYLKDGSNGSDAPATNPNLLDGTGFAVNLSEWSYPSSGQVGFLPNGMLAQKFLRYSGTDNQWDLLSKRDLWRTDGTGKVRGGTWYTLSFYHRGNVGRMGVDVLTPGPSTYAPDFLDTDAGFYVDGEGVGRPSLGINHDFANDEQWTRRTVTFKTAASLPEDYGSVYLNFYTYGIAHVLTRDFAAAEWDSYAALGHEEAWYFNVQGTPKVGELMAIMGTTTDTGEARTLVYRIDSISGKYVTGTCVENQAPYRDLCCIKLEEGMEATPWCLSEADKMAVTPQSYQQTQEGWSNHATSSNAATPPEDLQDESLWADVTPDNSYGRMYLWRRSRLMTLNSDHSGYDAGRWAYVRLSGINGASLKNRGAVADATKRSGPGGSGTGTAGTAVLTSGTTITMENGDAVIQQDNGHMYQWLTEGGAAWHDLGQFKGDAGVTYFTHVVWAKAVSGIVAPYESGRQGQLTKPNVDADSSITGFSTGVNHDSGYAWQGIMIDTDSADSTNARLYTWNRVEGAMGPEGSAAPTVVCSPSIISIDTDASGKVVSGLSGKQFTVRMLAKGQEVRIRQIEVTEKPIGVTATISGQTVTLSSSSLNKDDLIGEVAIKVGGNISSASYIGYGSVAVVASKQGDKGDKGDDGTEFERKYILWDRLTPAPKSPDHADSATYNPKWQNTMQSPTQTRRYVFVCERSKPTGGQWGDWRVALFTYMAQDGTSISIKGQAKGVVPLGGAIDDYEPTSQDGDVYLMNNESDSDINQYTLSAWVEYQANMGDGYLVDGDLWIKVRTASASATLPRWLNVGRIKGDKGDTGKMVCIVGEYDPTVEYTSDDRRTVAVEVPREEGDKSDLYELVAATNVTASGRHVAPTDPDSGDIWERSLNDYNLIRSRYLFTDFAKLGSFVVSGDFFISQYGTLIAPNGTEKRIDSQEASKMYYHKAGNGSIASSSRGGNGRLHAYMYFNAADPMGEDYAVATDLTFRPMKVVNALTGEEWMAEGKVHVDQEGNVTMRNVTMRDATIQETLTYQKLAALTFKAMQVTGGTSDSFMECKGIYTVLPGGYTKVRLAANKVFIRLFRNSYNEGDKYFIYLPPARLCEGFELTVFISLYQTSGSVYENIDSTFRFVVPEAFNDKDPLIETADNACYNRFCVISKDADVTTDINPGETIWDVSGTPTHYQYLETDANKLTFVATRHPFAEQTLSQDSRLDKCIAWCLVDARKAIVSH